MFWNAINGVIPIDGAQMEYICFGTGKKTLILLPGLGDGLKTVKGTAVPMALMYRIFSKDYTVYMFSRKHPLPGEYSTREMAVDQARAMELLGIEKADVVGVSMGGMIAQYLALNHPEMVGKLVLTVTSAGPNEVLQKSVTKWIALAERGDHAALMEDNMRAIYSQVYCRKNGWMIPLLGRFTKPMSYDRFLTQAAACLTHDALDLLGQIHAPTLVIGGEKDLTLGPDVSREIAERICGARLLMYPQWGHGLYEEEKGFNQTVLDFLRE